MKGNRKTYNILHLVSAGFLILTLLWLTISIPFVYASQQELAKQQLGTDHQFSLPAAEEETTNPLGNTTEEKAPGNSLTSVSEEYLHDSHSEEGIFSIASQYHNCEDFGTYLAFHGELLVPPPNVG